jgi:hypothetical protein
MSYTKTTWTDEIPASTPVKYVVTDDVLGEVAGSATIALATPITAGTPLNATNLNKIETGIETAQATAEAAIPKSLATAIGQILYSTAANVWAVLVKPAFTAVLQMSSGGTPVWRSIKQTVQLQILDGDTNVETVFGIGYFFVPSSLNGYNLVRAQAMVLTAGTTNPTTIQIRNLTKYASNDALSTAISIASAGTVGTAGTVDTSYDDVSTDDKIKVYVTANSTTPARGLFVVLEYQLP